MDFSWSEEQLAFKEAVIKFAKNELNSGLIERDREGKFPWKIGKNAPILACWVWLCLKNTAALAKIS